MIRVALRSQDECITGFDVKGHAGYAEAGQDIVCAAVSVLTTTCVNALETVAGVKPTVKTSDGRMRVVVPRNSGHDAQVILQTLRQGLRDLAEEYSRYILLNEL